MPLIQGKTRATISKNIEIEKHAHPSMPTAQAAAIAYSETRDAGKGSRNISRLLPSASKRECDTNGWVEISDNPISKAGVFQYLGATLDPEGEHDLIPDKIYNVYRPAEELSDPACIESFKLLPWTDEHAMLGPEEEGLTPAEKKGVHGVIGEQIEFKDGYLKANIKVFSEKMAKKIQDGKRQLSIGYRCLYDFTGGVYDNTHYDAIQREIRGNHVALVGQGRSGPDVAVLDHFTITLDGKELIMPDKKVEDKAKDDMEEETMDSLRKENMDLKEKLSAKDADPADFVNRANVSEDKDEETEDADEKRKAEDGDHEKKSGDYAKDKKHGMDSAIAMDAQIKDLKAEIAELRNNSEKLLLSRISRRDSLAKKLMPVIGVFDHKEKTLEEVERYAVKKLNITCKEGHESSVLDGYLAAYRPSASTVVGMDSALPQSDDVMSYIKGA